MNRLSYTLLSTPGRVPVVGLRLLSTSDPACNRPNIRHPRHPNFPRLKLLTLAEPKFSVKHETTEKLWQDCPLEREKRLKKERAAPNEWERLYAEELRNHLEGSKMTGIFHTNYIKHKQRHEVSF